MTTMGPPGKFSCRDCAGDRTYVASRAGIDILYCSVCGEPLAFRPAGQGWMSPREYRDWKYAHKPDEWARVTE